MLTKEEWIKNRELALEEFAQKKITLDCFPCSLKFEINNSCNCKCIFCNTSSFHNNDKLTFAEIDRLVPYSKYATLVRTSSVAEPFTTIREYAYLVSQIRKINPYAKMKVFTNGLLMDEALSVIQNNKIDVVLSLHALSEDKYRKMMGCGSFSKVVRNIDLFNTYVTNSTMRINCILSDFCDPLKMIDFAVEHAVRKIYFLKCSSLDTPNLEKTVKEAKEYAEAQNVAVNFWYWGTDQLPQSVEASFDIPQDNETFSHFIRNNTCPCDAPWFHLMTTMMSVQHCICSGCFSVGEIKDDVREVWNGSYFQNLRKNMLSEHYPAACNCKYIERQVGKNQVQIKAGDCLSGLIGNDWHRIYDLPSNSQFREENPDPDKIIPGSIINLI